MDKKILLQNLADSLSERTGMTKRKAENFVRSFFEVTEEGLLADGVVKVKGFGTTKVVKVNDRESVNINTGERFQIEGHAKVTFTPDAPFKDLVNRPFAQFTTIVLEDDVDLEELNAVDADAEEETALDTTENSIEDTAEETANEPDEEAGTPAETDETVAVEVNAASLLVAAPNEGAIEEPAASEEEAAASEEEPATSEEEPAAREEEPAASEEEPDINEEQAPEDMQQPIIIQNTLPAPPPHNWWRIAFFTLLAALLMVASYFAGYYRIFCPCTSDCIGEQPLPADTTCTTEPKDTLKTQENTADAPKAEATTTEATTQQANTQAQAEEPKETPAPKGPTAAEREAAKKYRQMEGGEYLITGVIETHKMAVGDNLFKLAKKAYGDKDLANYIIFHNRFTNPDVIQLGQDIEIPKLTHK